MPYGEPAEGNLSPVYYHGRTPGSLFWVNSP
jgi:hypothetical protein